MWIIFKIFIEVVMISLLFYVLGFFFGPEARGIVVPHPGIESTLPALEGKVLSTGPPGRSPEITVAEG